MSGTAAARDAYDRAQEGRFIAREALNRANKREQETLQALIEALAAETGLEVGAPVTVRGRPGWIHRWSLTEDPRTLEPLLAIEWARKLASGRPAAVPERGLATVWEAGHR